MIRRAYEPLDRYLQPNKSLIIYGPRRTGKTTLLQNFLAQTPLRYKLVSGDDVRVQQLLSSQDFAQILAFVEGYDLLAIDEAQGIPAVGKGLKILVDQAPGLHVIATGSSSFELAGQVGEPLTGRKRTLTLYPLAQSELLSWHNRFELKERLGEFLVFGAYPEVVLAATRAEKMEIVSEIASSYLLKDVLALEQVKSSRVLWDLLKLLAFQVGSEVSYSELAAGLGIHAKTVQRYLDLLEKAFVVIRLGGFGRNLRQEVTSRSKYYFYDNGLRNAIIAQFNGLGERNDVGQLWENFAFVERWKQRAYTPIYANVYFWRTYDQQEIDLVEEREGKLVGYEMKWSSRKPVRPPRLWLETYPNAEFRVVTAENYLDWLL
ncbi:MAG: ATP-binding protein [Chloroflexota bacterium]